LDIADKSSQMKFSITTHDIHHSSRGTVMGSGRLISDSDKQYLTDLLNEFEGDSNEWLPSNLLMYNHQKMVWYVPSKKRNIFFSMKNKKQHYEVIWPSLIFFFDIHKGLRIAAYASKGKPSLKQPLYHAPLWNIYNDTRVCTGSCETTNSVSLDAMSIWEDSIFNTNFTHENHTEVLAMPKNSKKKVNYLKFIKDKSKTGQPIKATEMNPLKLTLNEWVKGRKHSLYY